ncbi:hypothetical protein Dimus_014616 [Dionaea muscipula]
MRYYARYVFQILCLYNTVMNSKCLWSKLDWIQELVFKVSPLSGDELAHPLQSCLHNTKFALWLLVQRSLLIRERTNKYMNSAGFQPMSFQLLDPITSATPFLQLAWLQANRSNAWCARVARIASE